VHPAGTFQDGWTEGLPCCSVALPIGIDRAACGAELSCMVCRTDVEHVESKSGKTIGLLTAVACCGCMSKILAA